MTLKAQAILLAAGRGERMRPLTDTLPKPLLQVQGKALMEWPLLALQAGGFKAAVVNTAWLGEKVESFFLDKNKSIPALHADSLLLNKSGILVNFDLIFSREGQDFGGALETAGGIVRALPQLEDVFWVAAGDVFAPGFEFTPSAVDRFAASGKLAHLWLVPNPAHNLRGDFGLSPAAENTAGGLNLAPNLALNLPQDATEPRYTYSTIGLYRQAFFALPYCSIPPGNPEGIKAPLAPMLRAAMDNRQVSAQIYTGPWTDVGTPERLAELNRPQKVS